MQALAPSGRNRLTVGDPVYTEGSASEFVIGTQALTPGGSIIVFGTLLSMDPAATKVVVVVPSAAMTIPVPYTVIDNWWRNNRIRNSYLYGPNRDKPGGWEARLYNRELGKYRKLCLKGGEQPFPLPYFP